MAFLFIRYYCIYIRIMPYVKNNFYQKMLFSMETHKDDFYTFSTVPDLAAKSEMYKEDSFNCRTVGILHSTEGRFYMTDIDTPSIKEDSAKIRVTMKYLKCPPPSAVVSYAIQIFGSLQWRNRPVLFAKILQVLNTPTAIRLRDTLNSVTSIHLATSDKLESDFEISFSDLNDTFILDST